MIRLRGKPLGGGVALGTATVLRAPNGIPLLPARMVAQMAKAARDAPIEPMEVVMVAREYEQAASMALPWAHVVGILAEFEQTGAVRPIPSVAGLHDVLGRIDDDALVLIDGDRGIVLVDPDAMALAAYQAERERISPRRRIFLDFAHQPAHTLDGREIHVLGRVVNLDDIRAALDGGADALYVPAESELVSGTATDDEQREMLLVLAEAAGGKTVTLEGSLDSVSMPALLRAAQRADFTFAAPLSLGPDGFQQLREYIQEVREELLEEDADFGDVRFAGVADAGEPYEEVITEAMLSRVIIDAPADGFHSATVCAWLDELIIAAKRLLLPVEVVLSDASTGAIESVLALGAAGLIVPPTAVQQTKEAVRAVNAALARETILQAGYGAPHP